jgi:predicted chitinase
MPYRTVTVYVPDKYEETKTFTKEQYEDGEIAKYAKELKEKYDSNPKYKSVKIKYKAVDSDTKTIDNPLQGAPYKSTFMLQSNPPEYYIRFGYVLEYIKDNILPKIKVSNTHSDNPPIFDIDTDSWDNHMYSLPNQISLDPRVCIVRNSNFITGGGTTQVFQELYLFKEADNGKSTNQNAAYPMNIYLNFKFVINCLKEDDRGDVNVFEFVSSICTGLNKALGGINNLEPIIDESSNTLKIIDTTPIPGYSGIASVTPYSLQLYGYHKEDTQYTSNFIRNIDLKTAITPEYATMITVGATAGGYVKGTEATAFSKWNVGLTDRFKEDFTPGARISVKSSGEDDEAEYNYVTKFISEGYVNRYGFTSFTEGKFKLVDDIIEGNISIVTEYYKYLLSKNKSESGGTIGFIPFKLSFSMDGLSGIKIYNKLNVNTEFLPKAYGKNMDLIITGVNHKLANSDWETSIEATVIPKAGAQSVVEIPKTVVQDSIKKVSSGINTGDAPLGPNPPKSGWVITHPSFASNTTKGKNIDIIIDAFKEYGVTNPYAIVGALCVMGKESGWIPQNEYLNYSKERLPEVWAAFSKTGKVVKKGDGKFNYNDLAAKYAGNAEKLANFVYGVNTSTPKGMRAPDKGTKKSNPPGSVVGNKVWGDGYKYRGRGFNQITWKATYEKYAKELGIDLINNPDKLNEPKIAAKAAVLFFRNVFSYGKIKDPITYWNNFTSVDEALVYFAKANSGSITNDGTNAINLSRGQRQFFNIVKN